MVEHNAGMATILVVDDEPIVREVVVRYLERDGHRTLEAGDGERARELLERELPNLVVLDVMLPGLSGLEVLRRLRADARTKFLPIVILTSSDEEKDLLDSYGLGANSYVRKPVDFAQFVDSVRQLGLYWLVLNRPAPTL